MRFTKTLPEAEQKRLRSALDEDTNDALPNEDEIDAWIAALRVQDVLRDAQRKEDRDVRLDAPGRPFFDASRVATDEAVKSPISPSAAKPTAETSERSPPDSKWCAPADALLRVETPSAFQYHGCPLGEPWQLDPADCAGKAVGVCVRTLPLGSVVEVAEEGGAPARHRLTTPTGSDDGSVSFGCGLQTKLADHVNKCFTKYHDGSNLFMCDNGSNIMTINESVAGTRGPDWTGKPAVVVAVLDYRGRKKDGRFWVMRVFADKAPLVVTVEDRVPLGYGLYMGGNGSEVLLESALTLPEKPERNVLHVSVLSASNLPAADSNGFSDPYVKICDVTGLIGDGAKTSKKSKTLDPVWNESFQFQTNYKLVCLKFAVMDWDLLSSDDLLGKLYVPVSILFDGLEHEHDFELFKRYDATHVPAGTLRLRLRMEWRIPIAIPGSWIPLGSAGTVNVGLGWDFSKKVGSLDLDASAAMLDSENRLVEAVSYSNLEAFDRAVYHSGDNKSGVGDGDDESISFDLLRLPAQVQKVAVVVNMFNRTFADVKSAYVRVQFASLGTVAFFRLGSTTSREQGLFLGYLLRHNGQFWFQTLAHEVPGNDLHSSLDTCVQILKGIENPHAAHATQWAAEAAVAPAGGAAQPVTQFGDGVAASPAVDLPAVQPGQPQAQPGIQTQPMQPGQPQVQPGGQQVQPGQPQAQQPGMQTQPGQPEQPGSPGQPQAQPEGQQMQPGQQTQPGQQQPQTQPGQPGQQPQAQQPQPAQGQGQQQQQQQKPAGGVAIPKQDYVKDTKQYFKGLKGKIKKMSKGGVQKTPLTIACTSIQPREFEGWMSKCGGDMRSWKRRYLVLSGVILYWFEKENSDAALGSLAITADMTVVGVAGKPFYLTLKAGKGKDKVTGAKKRSLELAVPTSEKQNKEDITRGWQAALQAAIARAQSGGQPMGQPFGQPVGQSMAGQQPVAAQPGQAGQSMGQQPGQPMAAQPVGQQPGQQPMAIQPTGQPGQQPMAQPGQPMGQPMAPPGQGQPETQQPEQPQQPAQQPGDGASPPF
jgi:stress response protein SCP2